MLINGLVRLVTSLYMSIGISQVYLHIQTVTGLRAGGVAFNSESIFILTLGSPDNIRITTIHEFIDTKLAAEFAAAASAAAAPK